MKTELLIASQNENKIFEVSNSVTTCSWSTERAGSPGKFTFTIEKSGDLSFHEGDVVRFSVDGELQFYGWTFTKDKDRWGEISVTCYDRLRYLKANASYTFYDQSAGDIIRQIAGDLQIDVHEIEDTGYKLPSLVEEDQSCLDIIDTAIQQTLLNTGEIYVMYDDGIGLCLKEAGNMKSKYMVGTKSLLTEYQYKTDIDKQTYNSIKLARPNEETGRTDVFIAQDSSTQSRWGTLQLYQSLDGDINDAQAIEQAQVMLNYYNRKMRTLSVTALGIPGLRAGQMLLMKVPDLGDISLDQYVLLEKVTHTWTNDSHTMDFDTLAL